MAVAKTVWMLQRFCPKRSISLSLAPRKLLAPVNSQIASMMLVFPWAFSPNRMLIPSQGESSARTMLRKSRSSSDSMTMPAS